MVSYLFEILEAHLVSEVHKDFFRDRVREIDKFLALARAGPRALVLKAWCRIKVACFVNYRSVRINCILHVG